MTTYDQLPIEIVSHIQSFIPMFDYIEIGCKIESNKLIDKSSNVARTLPNHAIVSKKWFDDWKNNVESDYFKKTHKINQDKHFKIFLISHLGFANAICFCLSNKLFHVLDLFLSSKYLDKSHEAWIKGRSLCIRDKNVLALEYLNTHKLGEVMLPF